MWRYWIARLPKIYRPQPPRPPWPQAALHAQGYEEPIVMLLVPYKDKMEAGRTVNPANVECYLYDRSQLFKGGSQQRWFMIPTPPGAPTKLQRWLDHKTMGLAFEGEWQGSKRRVCSCV